MSNTNTDKTLAERIEFLLEGAESCVAGSRQALAEQAADRGAETLLLRVQQLAEDTVQVNVFTTALHIAKVWPENLAGWCFEQATLSSDDTWSGRGNDLKRCEADARRKAVKQVMSQAVRTGLVGEAFDR
jgi:hypothetical protein